GGRYENARTMFQDLTYGPVIVNGSSMGGWIGLQLAMIHPDRIKGFIGIAAAPDFTAWTEGKLTPAQARALEYQGYFAQPHGSADQPYRFRKDFLDDARRQWLMQGGRIPYGGPVRLLQGMKDSSV